MIFFVFYVFSLFKGTQHWVDSLKRKRRKGSVVQFILTSADKNGLLPQLNFAMAIVVAT